MSEYVEIKLTHGKTCFIDRDDYALIMRYSWRYSRNSKKRDVGYAVTTTRKPEGGYATITMHRVLLDPPKDKQVDHINGDRLDNRRANLRLASVSQNSLNVGKRSSGTTSRFKGVFWNSQKSKWAGTIAAARRQKHLGFFHTEEEAALAYDRAAIGRDPEFAQTNFPKFILGKLFEAETLAKQGESDGR